MPRDVVIHLAVKFEYLLLLPQHALAAPSQRITMDETAHPPIIENARELTCLCDVNDIATGAFLRSTFSYVDDNARIWFGIASVPRRALKAEDFNTNFRLVQDESVYPRAFDGITIASVGPGDIFIKRPKLSYLDDKYSSVMLPRLFLDEILVLEILKQRPHPNLAEYYGCSNHRGFITGILLKKYNATLEEYLDSHKLPHEHIMAGLEAGIQHLHTLGYAHNDLNPTNIMLDDSLTPVIIDFGSCKRVGEGLVSAGTPGWADDYEVSDPEHDKAALKKLRRWLNEAMKQMG